jgi:hypothetical protein
MGWTTPKTWSAGETLTAVNFNTHIRDNLNVVDHLLAFKSADETVSASTTLQDDDHLFFSVGANEVWAVRLGMYMTASSTGHIKIGATFPAATTFSLGMPWSIDASSVENRFLIMEATEVSDTLFLASGLNFFEEAAGVVVTAGTSGTFRIQWAQSSAAGTTTMKKGSYLIGQKLA